MENLYLFTIGLLLIVIVYLALKMNHHKYWHKHYKEEYKENEDFIKYIVKSKQDKIRKSFERKQRYKS